MSQIRQACMSCAPSQSYLNWQREAHKKANNAADCLRAQFCHALLLYAQRSQGLLTTDSSPELWAKLRSGIRELSVQLSQDFGERAQVKREAPSGPDLESVITPRLHEYISRLSSEDTNPGLQSPPPSSFQPQPSRRDSATPILPRSHGHTKARLSSDVSTVRVGLDPESRERIADEVTVSLRDQNREYELQQSNHNIIGWLDSAENGDPDADARPPSEHLSDVRSDSPDPRIESEFRDVDRLPAPWDEERKASQVQDTFPWADPIRPRSSFQKTQPDTSNAAIQRFQSASRDNETSSQVASDGGGDRKILSGLIAQSVLSWWSSNRSYDSTILQRYIQDLIAVYEHNQIRTKPKYPDIRPNISRSVGSIVSPPVHQTYAQAQESPNHRVRDDESRRLLERPMRTMSTYSESSDLKHKARSTDNVGRFNQILLPRPTPGSGPGPDQDRVETRYLPERAHTSRETWKLPGVENVSNWSPSQTVTRPSAPDTRYREIHSVERPRIPSYQHEALRPRPGDTKDRADDLPSLIKAVSAAPARMELAPGGSHVQPPEPTSGPESQDNHSDGNNSLVWEQKYSDQTSRSLVCPHPDCKDVLFRAKNPSDLKKHMQHHLKPFKCQVPGCTRTEGFSTKNDLERHQKSIHKLAVRSSFDRSFKCQGRNCHKSDKIWPRLDNFKSHCSRMHPDEDVNDLVKR